MRTDLNFPPASSPVLKDNFGRTINYLRLAVTDRCNLRCRYCMPEKGIDWIPRREILTYEEMLRLVRILARLGIHKVRLTGGEPFLRKNLISFLQQLRHIPQIKSIHITTNGVLTAPFIPQLKSLPIDGVNLSLDTLQEERFFAITRRAEYSRVMETFHLLLQHKIPLKINMVVMPGFNEDEIVPMAQLARKHPVEVRFIEQMPFNGTHNFSKNNFNWKKILQTLKNHFPDLHPIANTSHTARLYHAPGFKGRIGIIGGFSRIFCDHCSRLRITARGMLKTCLYDNGVLDVKAMLRGGASDDAIAQAIVQCVQHRAANGFLAEQRAKSTRQQSMATIGG